MNRKTNKQTHQARPDYSGQKAVRKRYIVSPQTAYHIQELAFQEQTTEGRIIDKIMRSYLCNRASIYQNRK